MGDWYSTISDVADKLAITAKSGYDVLQNSVSDLTSSIDSNVFNATTRQTIFAPAPPPDTHWDILCNWIIEHKYTILALSGVTGASAFVVYRAHARKNRKRRAARTANASRKEVLIITNFTTNAISKVVALDLERRGFIVFCACQTPLEQHAIENEGRADIRPLLIQKGESAYPAIEKFGSYLNVPAPAYHGGHTLHFAGLILAPPSQLPSGPLEVLDTEQISHSLNVGLCWPTNMIQFFLPLLREHSGRIIFMNEWIIPSLHTPFYAPTVTTSHAIQAMSQTLSREIPSLFTVHLRLGTFDLAHHHTVKNATRADILGWSPSLRAAYSSSYRNSTKRPIPARVRGDPLKVLHHAVFDALTDTNPSRQVNVGAGVSLYQWIADWMPELALRHMLGIGISSGDEDWEVLDQ